MSLGIHIQPSSIAFSSPSLSEIFLVLLGPLARKLEFSLPVLLLGTLYAHTGLGMRSTEGGKSDGGSPYPLGPIDPLIGEEVLPPSVF